METSTKVALAQRDASAMRQCLPQRHAHTYTYVRTSVLTRDHVCTTEVRRQLFTPDIETVKEVPTPDHGSTAVLTDRVLVTHYMALRGTHLSRYNNFTGSSTQLTRFQCQKWLLNKQDTKCPQSTSNPIFTPLPLHMYVRTYVRTYIHPVPSNWGPLYTECPE